jgi:hypothetical protein
MIKIEQDGPMRLTPPEEAKVYTAPEHRCWFRIVEEGKLDNYFVIQANPKISAETMQEIVRRLTKEN